MDSTLRHRIRRRLYNSSDPGSRKESPSLPLTEASVDYFRESFSGEEGLDRLDLPWASTVCRKKAVSPCSMVMSLVYAKRLRQRSKVYLQAMSSSDVFFISMMMASKYLYDEGVEEEVFNDDWADSTGKDVEDVNRMEMDFLSEMDWHLYVKHEEFNKALTAVERRLAVQEGLRRGWLTYTEMDVLLDWDTVLDQWNQVSRDCVKVLSILSSAYLSSLLSLFGATVIATQLSQPMATATLTVLSLSSSLLTQTTPGRPSLLPLDPLFPKRSFLQESVNASQTPVIEPHDCKKDSLQEAREEGVVCRGDIFQPPLTQLTNSYESDEDTKPKAKQKSASLLFLCLFDSLLSQAHCLFGPQEQVDWSHGRVTDTQQKDWSHGIFAQRHSVPQSNSKHADVNENAKDGVRCIHCGQLKSSNKFISQSYSHKSPLSFASYRQSGGLDGDRVSHNLSHSQNGPQGCCLYHPVESHPGWQHSPQPTAPALSSPYSIVNLNNCSSRLFPESWNQQVPSPWLADLPNLDPVRLFACNLVPSGQSVSA